MYKRQENNKPECIELLNQKTKDKPAIEVKALPSVYGTGAELILIEKCLGREVPHGGLPADAGATVSYTHLDVYKRQLCKVVIARGETERNVQRLLALPLSVVESGQP